MRCLTVTANAAVDTTYVLDSLAPGEIHRVARKIAGPGGKGNNVARVLARLGHDVVATGFAAGHAGRFIEEGLRGLGIEPAFVPVPGESRLCLTIVEESSGRISEIREPGVPVPPDAADGLLAHAARLAQDADAVAVCGSLAPGLPPDFYARLLAALRPSPAYLALDASGDALRLGLAGHPHLVSPNAAELSTLLNLPTSAPAPDLIAAARARLLGPLLTADATVLLSLGAAGAALVRRGRVHLAAPPPVAAVNTVGCGDALLAGFLDAHARALPAPDALAHAVAVGTAAALQEAVAAVAPDDIPRLRPRVRVTEVLDATAA